MATVLVEVESTSTQFPAGTVPAGIVITIDGITPQTVAAAPYKATFENVGPGTYTASAQAVSSTGTALGAAFVSTPFTVSAPDVNVDVPASVTVTIS